MTTDLDVQRSERFSLARLPMAAVSLDGELLLTNEALGRCLGRSADSVVGLSLADLVSPADALSVAQVCADARAGHDGGDVSVTALDTDRGQRRLAVSWSLMRRHDGTPWYITVVLVDQTDRARAEEERAGSEARWRALLRNSSDLTWTADAAGTVLWVATSVENRLGWDAQEIVGRCASDFVHEPDRAEFRQAWHRLAAGQDRQQVVDYRVADAAGNLRWYRATLTDMRNEPCVGALVGNVVDISELRAQEQERAWHEARFRARFEQSSVAQSQVDAEGRLVLVNDALCALLGRTAEELLGQPIAAFTHADDDGSADGLLRQILSGRVHSGQVERLMTCGDGSPLPTAVNATALRGPDGGALGAAAYLLDLRPLRESERMRFKQEELHAAFARLASDLALVTDAKGTVLYASPAITSVFGYDVEQVVLRDAATFVHPEDADAARTAFATALEQPGPHTLLLRVQAADGSWRWVEKTLTDMRSSSVGGLVCNLRDVTARVVAEEALRASEEKYRAIADTAEEGIWAVDPTGRTLYANARMASIVGLPLEEVYARRAVDLLPAEDGDLMAQRLATRAQRGSERYELRYEHPDGSLRWLRVSASPLRAGDGSAAGSLAMVSDITDVRRVERELAAAALSDSLTGLPNRALLLDRLGHALARETSIAVLFIDLDHFKLVNDSRGHGVGDELLIAAADRLRELVSSRDTVARFGGDEFVVVCEDTEQDAALQLADEVLGAFSAPFVLSGGRVDVGASVGVALASGGPAEDVLRYADTAMYAAKAAGRGRVRLFDQTLAEEVEERYALATDLREALTQEQLFLHHQPLIDLRTGRVLGMETLVRWDHPDRGPISPSRFLEVAESTGFAPHVDAWVLRRALLEAGRLHAEGALPSDAFVSINLSTHTLVDAVLDDLGALTEAAGLTPAQVVLEITEGAVMQDTARSAVVLGRLREQGFGIAVDDFGTGYSSLAYLRDLPITCLKIDRSFIADITSERDALAIVASIVDLARAVDVTVVAEGVETYEQAALLQKLGCTAGQGWLWSPALPAAEISLSGAWNSHFEIPVAGRSRAAAAQRAAMEAGLEVREAHGLSRLLELHQQGASLSTIASALNAEGFRTPSGLRWHRASVARTVASTAYPSVLVGPTPVLGSS